MMDCQKAPTEFLQPEAAELSRMGSQLAARIVLPVLFLKITDQSQDNISGTEYQTYDRKNCLTADELHRGTHIKYQREKKA